MAVYNASADAANTGVRAFLTKIGEYYLGSSFNTGTGRGKKIWENIRDDIFNSQCAYCGKKDSKLQIEHLIMFNRVEYGLHHPGNIVPVCFECNKRSKDNNNNYKTWTEHLEIVCRKKQNDDDKIKERILKIENHINLGKYKYPVLNSEERKAMKIIANSLYESIKNEFDRAVKLFEDLDDAYIKKNNESTLK